MERSRARAMAEMITTRQLSLPGADGQQLYAESARLRAAIAARQTELFRSINGGAKPDTLAPVEREISSLENAYRKLLARISVEAPKLLELTTARAVPLRSLQEQMKQDDFEVLEYLVTETAVILWHINADGVHVRNVFLPRSELLTKAEALQKSLLDRNNAFDRKTARELYLFLIEPAARWIRSKRLVIVPDGALHSVPFQVLENPADGSSLGERYQLSYAPSATIQAGLRKTSPGGGNTLLAAADPEIPDAQNEVESIAKLLVMDKSLARVTSVGADPVRAGQRAWLVWDGKDGITYFQRKTEDNIRSLITVPRAEAKQTEITGYDPIVPVLVLRKNGRGE
jgi:CHAT domain-containing protein